MQPPLTPGDPRPSQRCAPARTAEHRPGGQRIGTTQHFPGLCTRAGSWAHLALPDRAGISRCLESHPPGERQSCTVWVALEFRAAVCIMWSVTRTENHRCLRSTISGPYKQRYQGSPSSPFGPQRAAPSDSLAAGRFSE